MTRAWVIGVVLFLGVAGGSGLSWGATGAPVSALDVSPAPPLGIITRVDNPDRRIAITFDACATKSQGYGFDRPVYQVLQRELVPATIFVSGRWVEFHPDEMTELAADPLIEFANHSYDHPHMGALSTFEIASEIDRTEAVLARYGRHSVAFRPPFGDFSRRVLEVTHDRQIPAVLWDVVSGDPSAAVTSEEMIRTVVRKTRPGSIVIFHINGRGINTASALAPILRELRERGFQFVHVSTLLASARISQPASAIVLREPPPDEDATMPLSPEVDDAGGLPVRAHHKVRDALQAVRGTPGCREAEDTACP